MVPWSKTSSTTTTTQTQVVEDFQNQNEKLDNVSVVKKPRESSESKETFRLELGSYRATIVPLVVLFFGFLCGTMAMRPMRPDPRVANWFLMQSSVVCLFICILYVLFSIVWGPRFMKDREPFKLRKTMITYNAFQVVLSTYMFCEVGFAGWFFDYNYRCEPCDYSYSPKALRIASVGWLFFISKIIDFTDTLFFILNKKWTNVSTLHVVHHSCMCISMYFGIRYSPGGHITFMGFLNSGVHSIMYTYYFLSAIGPSMRPYLWWKRYLTRIQLIQFVAIFFHAAQNLVFDCPSVPVGLPIWTCIYAFIFFALFIDFYYRAYLYNDKLKKSKKAASEAASAVTNNNKSNGSAPIDNGFKSSSSSSSSSSHMRSPSNLASFRLDSCLRERQPKE